MIGDVLNRRQLVVVRKNRRAAFALRSSFRLPTTRVFGSFSATGSAAEAISVNGNRRRFNAVSVQG